MDGNVLRTEGGGRLLTPRVDKVVEMNQQIEIDNVMITGKDGWWIYAFEDFTGKYKFSGKINEASMGKLKKVDLPPDRNGTAFYQQPFAEGAERFVYRCTEIYVPNSMMKDDYFEAASESNRAVPCGLRFVAKEAKDIENHHLRRKFYETFARF